MSRLQEIYEEKKKLCMERDLCAEFYNLMLSKANKNVDDEEQYSYYLDVVQLMEPYARATKEKIRIINREICEIIGVQSITETEYHIDCEDRYGFSKPELD